MPSPKSVQGLTAFHQSSQDSLDLRLVDRLPFLDFGGRDIGVISQRPSGVLLRSSSTYILSTENFMRHFNGPYGSRRAPLERRSLGVDMKLALISPTGLTSDDCQ